MFRVCYFNPRTPCGVRLCRLLACLMSNLFQSTHPLRGATFGWTGATLLQLISIHAPLAGCDFLPLFPFGDIYISIHAPLAGCDQEPISVSMVEMISIHAPLAGCDPYRVRKTCPRCYFNPRTPCGVRHGDCKVLRYAFRISIHAPLAGCDSKIAEIFPANLRKSYKISAKPNKERRCRVLGKGKAAAISGLARCEPPGENRNASGSHQIMSAPSGA